MGIDQHGNVLYIVHDSAKIPYRCAESRICPMSICTTFFCKEAETFTTVYQAHIMRQSETAADGETAKFQAPSGRDGA